MNGAGADPMYAPLLTQPAADHPGRVLAAAVAGAAIVVRADSDAPIAELLRRIRAAVPQAGVLVESPDAGNTADLARAAARELGGIQVMSTAESSAVSAFEWAAAEGYETIVEIPGNLAYDPAEVIPLLARLEAADVVVGRRRAGGRGIGWHLPLVPSRYASLLSRRVLRDPLSPFRAYRVAVVGGLEGLDPRRRSRGAGTHRLLAMIAAAHRAGFRVAEVPISFSERSIPTRVGAVGGAVRTMSLVTWWALRQRSSSPPRQ